MNTMTKEILFDDGDYFVITLTNGNVRIGLKGAIAFDLPPGHYHHEAALAARGEAVESLHDALIETMGRVRKTKTISITL